MMTEPTRPPTKAELQLRLLELADIAAEANAAARDIKRVLEGSKLMVPGDHGQPTIPTGDPVEPTAGTVTFRRPSASVMITDNQAFMAWMDDTHPLEVELIERCRPAFWSLFAASNGVVVGPHGELDIPGLAVVLGGASIAAVTDKKNLDQLRQNMRGMTLGQLLDVPAIEASHE